MATARDIIKSSLRHIAVLGTGSHLDATEADDALKLLNVMLSSWSAKGNLLYVETKETFPLTTASTYTIGSGGVFDTVRPVDIRSAYVSQGDIDYTLTEYNNAQYSSISSKESTGGIPIVFYYDGDAPLANIHLYPKPTSVSSITINSQKPLATFTSLDTDFTFPAEYQMALEMNLAVLIAPQYEKEASVTIQKEAMRSLKTVSAQMNKRNYPRATLDVPSRCNTGYNIYEGK